MMTTLSTNLTDTGNIPSEDVNGPIIYIFGVLIWYALGFGLILIDDLYSSSDRRATHIYGNVHQTMSDLHEQQARNDLLVELKDENRRTKLWEIYYGTQKHNLETIQKDQASVELINKQLDELKSQRRVLRHSLHDISFDQDDSEQSDHNRSVLLNLRNNLSNKSIDNFASYFK